MHERPPIQVTEGVGRSQVLYLCTLDSPKWRVREEVARISVLSNVYNTVPFVYTIQRSTLY